LNPKYAAAFNSLGVVYCKAEKWENAVHSYMEALEINVEFDAVYLNLKTVEWSKVSYEFVLRTLNFMKRIMNPDQVIKEIIKLLTKTVEEKHNSL
jgi:tetratricopeptide (TPR) repeat protein